MSECELEGHQKYSWLTRRLLASDLEDRKTRRLVRKMLGIEMVAKTMLPAKGRLDRTLSTFQQFDAYFENHTCFHRIYIRW